MREHLGLKLVSLLLGFSLWYAVAREQEAEFSLSIPVELRDLPEGLEVVEQSVQQVEIRLRGPAENLRRLSAQDVHIGVELEDAEPGERVADLTPRDVTAPFGARVMRVTPSKLELVLDRTVRRTVEVIPRVVGSPAAGFELHEIDLLPSTLDVEGPSSHVEDLAQVTTEPVSVDGLREPYSRRVRVEVDPLVRGEREMSVAVTLDVREQRLRRQFSGVSVKLVPEGRSARLAPGTVEVRVEGPRSLVEPLRPEDIVARVDTSSLAPGQHSLAPQVVIASASGGVIEVLTVQPAEVQVLVQ
jgi:YbbR domain-containing protein